MNEQVPNSSGITQTVIVRQEGCAPRGCIWAILALIVFTLAVMFCPFAAIFGTLGTTG